MHLLRRYKRATGQDRLRRRRARIADRLLFAFAAIAELVRAFAVAKEAVRHACQRLGCGNLEGGDVSHPDCG